MSWALNQSPFLKEDSAAQRLDNLRWRRPLSPKVPPETDTSDRAQESSSNLLTAASRAAQRSESFRGPCGDHVSPPRPSAAEIITGSSLPSASNTSRIAPGAALAFSESKIVSTKRRVHTAQQLALAPGEHTQPSPDRR